MHSRKAGPQHSIDLCKLSCLDQERIFNCQSGLHVLHSALTAPKAEPPCLMRVYAFPRNRHAQREPRRAGRRMTYVVHLFSDQRSSRSGEGFSIRRGIGTGAIGASTHCNDERVQDLRPAGRYGTCTSTYLLIR